MMDSVPYGLTTWLVGAATGFLVYLMIRRPRGIPPGPKLRVPVLGYLPFAGRDLLKCFRDLRKTYGDIFHLYLGDNIVIVLNGYDVIKEALVQHGDVFSDRPVFKGLEEFGAGKGIITSSGTVWKDHRKFALEALREFGFGRNILQDKIHEEVTYFLSAMEEEKGQPFDIRRLIHTAVSNVTCNIIFGKRFQYDDEKFHQYLRILEESIGRSPALIGLILLRKLPGDVTGYHKAVKGMNHLRKELIDASMKEHLDNYQPGVVNDFIDAYIKEMKENEKRKAPTAVTEDHLFRVIIDLFIAGTETTGTTIRWALLYLLNYPSIQDRLYNELQEKVGSGRLPTMGDKKELAYFNAFILEVQRHANIAPFGVPHTTSEDTIFRGYRFPKGVFIFPSLDSIFRDPATFKDPDTFQPERFLQNGSVDKPEQLIPFGIGRRVCLGESLAKMELFLFLSAMIQRFRFECVDEKSPPEIKGKMGTIHPPLPFEMRAVRRT